MESIYRTIDDHRYVNSMDEHELEMHTTELEDAYAFLAGSEYPKMAAERRRLLDLIKRCLRRVESVTVN